MSSSASIPQQVGLVAIGRNEGERLRACLESARAQCDALVYVDSGSVDGSVEMARELGATIVELESDVPFTAARARNAGFEALERLHPKVELVQFVDGDCELELGWIEAACQVLAAGDWVVVCGRRRERYPDRTIYNRLCDMEWDTPIGEATACGGDALMRVSAFREVGGYSDDLIAGEEPELCARLAAAGGRILRIDAPMTLHDADMFSFSQWWTRAVRAGHANAEGAARHPRAARGRNEREVRSTWFWGVLLPGIALMLAAPTGGASLLLLLGWPLQIARIARNKPRPNFSTSDQWLYATACVIGKLPNAQGQIRFLLGRITGRRSRLIEYKQATTPSSSAERR